MKAWAVKDTKRGKIVPGLGDLKKQEAKDEAAHMNELCASAGRYLVGDRFKPVPVQITETEEGNATD